jgi:hypothetical protein
MHAFLTTKDGVFLGVRAVELSEDTTELWSSEVWSEVESVQSKKMIVCQIVICKLL